MLFRIWLNETKQMVTCSDYLVAANGDVYGVANNPPYLRRQWNAYVMRASDYEYKEDMSGDCLYEFDIINYDGDIAIVYFADAYFQAYFAPNDSQWLDQIDMKTEGELVTNYFKIKDDPEWADFINSLPAWIKPDGA